MRFVIIGAGGIGCYYAAKLLKAGHECVLIARGQQLQALVEAPLGVSHPEFCFREQVTATDIDGLCSDYQADDFDLLILSTKGGTTAELMAQLKLWLTDSALPVLSLQNGVSNEPLIAQVISKERTLGGLAVKIGAHTVHPGMVEATGEARIEFGAWPSAPQNPGQESLLITLSSVFSDAGIPNRICQDVSHALWCKLVINNGVNPLSALTLKNTGELTSDPTYRHTVYKMMQETARAANAAGVALTDADVEEMFQLICNFEPIKTSMQVDREKGRPMELNEICQPVIEYCKQASKPAETTELIYRLLVDASQTDPV